ncbi:hypothetical protein MESS4_780023 [Mesorhizobium sp. STM 4661]|nr:hypothetical protein MESS4_780023 [Mesorhizobium sp. STM 4661]
MQVINAGLEHVHNAESQSFSGVPVVLEAGLLTIVVKDFGEFTKLCRIGCASGGHNAFSLVGAKA